MNVKAFKPLMVTMLVSATLACNYVSSLVGGSSDSSILKDDFSDNGSGWGTGTDSDSSVEYMNEGLYMKVFKDNFFTWSHPDKQTYTNVHMEVTAKNPSTDSRPAFGLMCNQKSTENSYYYFAVTTASEYVIGKSASGQDDVFLTNNDEWGKSDLIPSDAPSYRIGADCGGGTLTLYVNGAKVDSVTDATYTDGEVGLFLWTGDKPGGEVTYDDFVMKKLGK